MNRLLKYCSLLSATLMFNLGSAMAQFPVHGKITYQKTFNLKLATQLEEQYKQMSRWAQNLPENIETNFVLDFDQTKSDYRFLPDTTPKTNQNPMLRFFTEGGIASQNTVLTNFKSGIQQALKKVFEKNYLIQDSIPKFKWKIEDDVRTIAGYPCRKAVTTICDSVVVVAFYSDQIMVSGGPESFNGLPGMILGIAIPRLYSSWWATKVSISAPTFPVFDSGKKKAVPLSQMLDDVESATHQWNRGNSMDFLKWQLTL